jgi:hypothetical protein
MCLTGFVPVIHGMKPPKLYISDRTASGYDVATQHFFTASSVDMSKLLGTIMLNRVGFEFIQIKPSNNEYRYQIGQLYYRNK